ncbi:IclR family transcriptional regulator [Conexibacter woesei]|uniref:Transcriptional regulator, IclR family n=1 Tax=Conexibacter woesei (strain DSM 14684 / CCUG 47730 / CIP 108061 / JCM 11494 / NBRC 100937 / ID131577) TaxID=469383 RepID=D3FDE3_CONWI|nr:IclR family transcriptional regulator [Conexibacter woesei]ADB53535.1 transcriptional regulator, IclR family [Conexibacter woesei DSM 14684]
MSRTAGDGAPEGVGYQSRALTRGLAILSAFDDGHPVLTPAQLHERLQIPKPTIVRLAMILEQEGFLRRADGSYRLGPRTFELGQVYLRGMHLADIVQPVLEEVGEELEETVCLASLHGPEVVHLAVVRSSRPVHYVTEVGERAAAHASGLGKALLAGLAREEVAALLGPGPYPRFTDHTLLDAAALAADLERTRERGYARDMEEAALGLRCVAVAGDLPLLGRVGVSVSGPAADYDDATAAHFARRLAAALPRLRDALARTLGERPAG